MLAAYTKLRNAQKVKNHLAKKDIIDTEHLPVKELGYIYFPITKKASIPKAKIVNTKFKFPVRDKPVTIDKLLSKKLTRKQLELLPRSQEIVGNIMILEVPKELEKKEKIIAEAYLKTNKNISTVVKKRSMHSGIFRTRKVTILAGKRTKETVHLENGIKLKLHLEKTYFSARSANERLRIARQVKKGEEIMVMFSGAAPYPLVLAKNSPAKKIYGVELNPLAHAYADENIRMNRLEKSIILYEGDVYEVLPKINKKFDRIVMPLPKTGEEFLPLALKKSRKGAIIHLYSFLHENEMNKYAKKVKEICTKNKREIKVLRKVKCGQFSPGTFRVCLDLKVLR